MKRLTEDLKLANLLPPLFICFVIGTIWSVYLFLHLLPMMQIGIPADLQDLELAKRGLTQFLIAQVLFSIFSTCYTRAILTCPGTIPETDEWRYTRQESAGWPVTQEVKETGERRRCKWCLKYKPDRCHHCRVCKTCVLRMDHHCPWIMNCVGWGNHKYFFLTVLYAGLSCGFIALTITESVHGSMYKDMPHFNRFLLVFCLVLAGFFAILMTGFMSFHINLMLTATTTIEFCEKRTAGAGVTAVYDRGYYQNILSVLGPRPQYWFLPIDPARGDGVHFGKFAWKNGTEADAEWAAAAEARLMSMRHQG